LLEAVRSLRTKIHQKIQRKGELDRNVKLSPGGIRDIEFIVQTLQLIHMATEPKLFEPNTVNSLKKLVAHHHLSPDVGKRLKTYYLYLRDLEHKLQMVHELQTHTLPSQDPEIRKCAIRMGYNPDELKVNPSPLITDYRRITEHVRNLVTEILF